ncbi:protein kinase [Vibrio makurazakiensis]|uniref:protein kinase domain-containing protein n=1 Tax=Vibrio makurazakiensis TaxID=2910250 RepID=UPI003D0BCAF4
MPISKQLEQLDTNAHSPLSLRGVSLLKSFGYFDFLSLSPRVLQANHNDWGAVVIKQAESIKHRFFLKNEAKFLEQHPSEYWPKYCDYFSAKGLDYLVVQYINGTTLSSLGSLMLLESKKTTAPTESSFIDINSLESALSALHSTGYIHGDIKPSNIVFSADESMKLVDFGSVRKIGVQLSNERFHSYTESFASPSMISGNDKVTVMDDWFSLAMTLTCLYTDHYSISSIPSRYSLIINNAQKNG